MEARETDTVIRSACTVIVALLLVLPGMGLPTASSHEPPEIGSRDAASAAQPTGPHGSSSAQLNTHTFSRTAWFEPNHGQLPSDALYHADLGTFHVLLYETRARFYPSHGGEAPLEFVFLDGAPEVTVSQQEPTGAVSHYYPTQTQRSPTEGVPHLRQVTYEDLWQGIDLVFRINEAGQLEYDLHLAAGASPSDARFAIAGQDRIELDADGSVAFQSASGTFRQSPPVAFLATKPHETIPAAPSVSGNSTLTFDLGTWPLDRQVIIDPTISYTTTFGGSAADYAYDVTADSEGNAYVIGQTSSPNFARDSECSPLAWCSRNTEAYLLKFDAEGALVWRTLFGGELGDRGNTVALDPTESYVYVGGSYGYPWYGFVGRFSTDRGGGFVQPIPYTNHITGVDIAPDGSVYAVDYTNVWGDPEPPLSISGAYQPDPADNEDALLVKLPPNLSEVTYLTYFGGEGKDWPTDVRVSPDGTVYIAVRFTLGNLPAVSPFQTYQGKTDGFIARFSPDGTTLLAGTYLGGTGSDDIDALDLDPRGNVYVLGRTSGSDFPATSEDFSTGEGGGFVVKLDPTLSSMIFGAVIPGMGRTENLAVTSSGYSYVTGSTSSPGFPAKNEVPRTESDGADAYLLLLDRDGDHLLYATRLPKHYGTSMVGEGVAAGPGGTAYVTGYINNYATPTRGDPPGSTYYGPEATGDAPNGFVTKVTCTPSGGLRLFGEPDCPPGADLFPLVAEDTEVQDDSVPVSPPPCAGTQSGCTPVALGYSDDPVTATTGETLHEINLGDFDGHKNVACERALGCTFWLDLDATVRGTVAEGTEGNSLSTAAHIFALGLDGLWHRLPGADLTAHLRTTATGQASIEIPDRLFFNGSVLPELEGSFDLKIVPQENPWDPDGGMWNVTVDAAQVQLVASPVLLLSDWVDDPHLDAAAYHQAADWTAQVAANLEQRAFDQFGQDPWAWAGNGAGITALSYDRKGDYREAAGEPLLAEIASIQRSAGFKGSIDTISHGLGGLVARYLVEPSGDPESPQSGLGRPELVRKLATIGTPHLGTGVADTHVIQTDEFRPGGMEDRNRYYLGKDGRNLADYERCQYWLDNDGDLHQSCSLTHRPEWREWWKRDIEVHRFQDGQPGHNLMADFELKDVYGEDGNPVLAATNTHVGAEDTDYLFLAGQSRLPLCLPATLPGGGWSGVLVEIARCIAGGGDVRIPVDTDGFAKVASQVLDVPDPSDLPSPFCHRILDPGTSPFRTHDILPTYGGTTQALFAFLTYPQPELCTGEPLDDGYELVLAGTHYTGLRPPGTGAQTASGPSAGASLSSTKAGNEETIDPPPAKTTATFQWTVTAATNATFTITAPNGTLEQLAEGSITLTAPDGSKGNLTESEIPGLAWSVDLTDGQPDQLIAHVQGPQDGTWTAQLSGTPPREIVLFGQAQLRTDLSLTKLSETSGRLGEPVTLAAGLLESGTPVPGASLTANVTDLQLGTSSRITLADDGQGVDDTAGDGVYAGSYLPLTPGTHRVVTTAQVGDVVRETVQGIPVVVIPGEASRTCAETLDLIGSPSTFVETDGGREALLDCLEGLAPQPS